MILTRRATVEEEPERPGEEETVQLFETMYGSVYEGGVLKEIKIAEVGLKGCPRKHTRSFLTYLRLIVLHFIFLKCLSKFVFQFSFFLGLLIMNMKCVC